MSGKIELQLIAFQPGVCTHLPSWVRYPIEKKGQKRGIFPSASPCTIQIVNTFIDMQIMLVDLAQQHSVL